MGKIPVFVNPQDYIFLLKFNKPMKKTTFNQLNLFNEMLLVNSQQIINLIH